MVKHLGKGTGLTLAHVREQSRQQTDSATAELSAEVFAERAADWQTTVRGHMLAAAEAIPDDTHLAHLREFIDQALAEIERL